MIDWIGRNFRVTAWRYEGGGAFEVVSVRLDWDRPHPVFGTLHMARGWYCLTVELFGCGVSVTKCRPCKREDSGVRDADLL